MVIEIKGRKFKLVKGDGCSRCVFAIGCICSLPSMLNVDSQAVDACESELSHWEEVEDEISVVRN